MAVGKGKRKPGKPKAPKEQPLARNGVVLRDFDVGKHTFKKGTRDSWDQVKLPGNEQRMLSTISVYLDSLFTADEDEKRMEEIRQQEADRQLERLALELEKEREEETRKRLAKIEARKKLAVQSNNRMENG